jgi:hypothetical protein
VRVMPRRACCNGNASYSTLRCPAPRSIRRLERRSTTRTSVATTMGARGAVSAPARSHRRSDRGACGRETAFFEAVAVAHRPPRRRGAACVRREPRGMLWLHGRCGAGPHRPIPFGPTQLSYSRSA